MLARANPPTNHKPFRQLVALGALAMAGTTPTIFPDLHSRAAARATVHLPDNSPWHRAVGGKPSRTEFKCNASACTEKLSRLTHAITLNQ
jgi:hypothetical protein